MEYENSYDYIKENYDENLNNYTEFKKKIEQLILNIMQEKNIVYQSVTSRVKDKNSLLEKIKRKGYNDGLNSVTDIIGVRIIAYTKEDVNKISQMIKSEFKIDELNSQDKLENLDKDRIGYLSIHYVVTFSDSRSTLTEYKKYSNYKCEVQIRTILQHAWAEIEHDKCYKFGAKLPISLERRFYLIAGVLEMMDNEFQQLSNVVDDYKLEIQNETKIGNTNLKIDTISLKEYLNHKIKYKNIESFIFNDVKVINELFLMDIINIGDLDKIMTETFLNKYYKTLDKYHIITNYTGLLRNVMIIYDVNKYFHKAWNNAWTGMDNATLQLYNEFKIYKKDLPNNIIIHDFELLPKR